MRVLVAAALIAIGLAGVSAVSAADLPSLQSHSYSARSYAFGHHAAQLLVYDFEPGVVVRAYWRAPWRHRHYFPHTGMRPRYGRRENLSARSGAPKPAKTFQRYWSTTSVFPPEAVRVRAQASDPEPMPCIEQFSPPKAVRP